MKSLIRRIFLSSIIKGSGNDLPLSDREKLMIKWFIKFELSIILLAVSWVTPGYAIYEHIYDYNNLKEKVAAMSIVNKTVSAKEITTTPLPETEQPSEKRTTEEEYNYLLETNEDFKNYINNMSVSSNNPGNLVFAGQPGATKSGRFASFPNSRLGFRALLKQIELDSNRGDTITTFYQDFAPAKENNTADLINGAITTLNITPTTKLKDIDQIELAKYITFREHSYK